MVTIKNKNLPRINTTHFKKNRKNVPLIISYHQYIVAVRYVMYWLGKWNACMCGTKRYMRDQVPAGTCTLQTSDLEACMPHVVHTGLG